jgi:hypothetical protein
MMRIRERWIWLAALVAVPTLAVIAVRFFMDEPLRRTIEHNMNQRLQGYTVRIRALHFHPLDFSLDLIDSTILQDAHPDPPIAHLPLLRASVNWRALLHRRLVADFLMDRPRLHINLKQARKEVVDKTPISQRGWQDADIRLDNLSNQSQEGTAVGTLKGKFMGSGDTLADVAFRLKAKSPDVNLKVQIQGTQMPAMNDVWRAHGDFDVVDGALSFYSELTLRDGRIDGYIKPMFKGMKVYDADQDQAKSFGQRLREILINAGAWIMENRERDEVATKINISGNLDSPQFSTWEAVAGLLRNAFLEAILPGLEPTGTRQSG